MNFIESENLWFNVSHGNEHHSHVSAIAEHGHVTGFLSSTQSSNANKCSKGLSSQSSLRPKPAGGVHEGLCEFCKTERSWVRTNMTRFFRRRMPLSSLCEASCSYLHLSRHGTISSRDSKNEAIIFGHLFRSNHRVIGLGRSTHLAENFVIQGLFDAVDIALGAAGLHSLLDGFRHGGHMAVYTVVDDRNFGHGE